MSNEPLEAYKKLYSEYISNLAELHYYHHSFVNNGAGRDSGYMVRRLLRKMIFLQKQMIDSAIEAHTVSLTKYRSTSKSKKPVAKNFFKISNPKMTTETSEQIRKAFDVWSQADEHFLYSNLAAGVTARKALFEMFLLSKLRRKEILEETWARRAAKSKAKPQ